MTEKTKIGVVGAGRMGSLHLQKYLQLESAELVGFYEADEARAKATAERLNLKAFSTLAELLYEADAVSIACPTASHFSVAKQALDAGVHVLVEKPITETEAEAETLIKLARANGLVLQVGFIERFRYRALTQDFPLSPARFIEGNRLSPSLSREDTVDVVSDLMIHDLDLALALVGEEPDHVSGIGVAVVTPRIDIANVRLEFPNKAVVNLNASRVATSAFRKFRVFSAKAYAAVDFIANRVEVYFTDPVKGIERHTVEMPELDALKEQCDHFLSRTRDGKAPLVTGEDGLRSLRFTKVIQQRIQERAAWTQSSADATP